MTKLFLGDELRDRSAVELSVLGSGFAFGFGVFETMKFLEGEPCFFGEHVERLRRAAAAAGLTVELDANVLREKARRLFAEEGVASGVFKIVVCEDVKGPLVAMFVRSAGIPELGEPERLIGSQVVKASNAFTSRHKSMNYMESILELRHAQSLGFDECVFFNEFGKVTECSVANLFWVEDGALKTPQLDCGLLDGIVRRKILEIAAEEGIACEEGVYEEGALLRADEVFLSSSGKGPRPAKSYQNRSGETKVFRSVIIERIRTRYFELELQSARKERHG